MCPCEAVRCIAFWLFGCLAERRHQGQAQIIPEAILSPFLDCQSCLYTSACVSDHEEPPQDTSCISSCIPQGASLIHQCRRMCLRGRAWEAGQYSQGPDRRQARTHVSVLARVFMMRSTASLSRLCRPLAVVEVVAALRSWLKSCCPGLRLPVEAVGPPLRLFR